MISYECSTCLQHVPQSSYIALAYSQNVIGFYRFVIWQISTQFYFHAVFKVKIEIRKLSLGLVYAQSAKNQISRSGDCLYFLQ